MVLGVSARGKIMRCCRWFESEIGASAEPWKNWEAKVRVFFAGKVCFWKFLGKVECLRKKVFFFRCRKNTVFSIERVSDCKLPQEEDTKIRPKVGGKKCQTRFSF